MIHELLLDSQPVIIIVSGKYGYMFSLTITEFIDLNYRLCHFLLIYFDGCCYTNKDYRETFIQMTCQAL